MNNCSCAPTRTAAQLSPELNDMILCCQKYVFLHSPMSSVLPVCSFIFSPYKLFG